MDDFRERVGNAVPYLIGNHGLEGLHATQQVVEQARKICRGWKQLIAERFGTELTLYGVFVEDKSYSLSFDYQRRSEGRGPDVVFQI